MSQHSQRTQYGPSIAAIVFEVVATAAAMTGTVYAVWSTGGDVSHLAGAVMGMVLSGILMDRTLDAVIQRINAPARLRRAEVAAFNATAEHWSNAFTQAYQSTGERTRRISRVRRTGEETRRIQGFDPGPLDGIQQSTVKVPVFRTEAERVMWATEHEIPTEFLPRVRDRS